MHIHHKNYIRPKAKSTPYNAQTKQIKRNLSILPRDRDPNFFRGVCPIFDFSDFHYIPDRGDFGAGKKIFLRRVCKQIYILIYTFLLTGVIL